MPRLKSVTSGVVVDVSDEMAARLDGFVSVDEQPADVKPARSKRAASSDDK